MKALGITAMILAIVSIFIPVAGPYLTIVCALLAAFSAGQGLTFGIVAILVNLINIAFLSPSLWLTAGIAEANEAGSLAGMGIVFIGTQIVAGAILTLIHLKWKKKQQSKESPA